KIGILKSWIVLDETLKDMFTDNGFPKCFKMADLGCSSGPNSFFVISHIINKVQELSEENKFGQSLVFQVFLNDLPGNDFNNLFKMLPTFYQKLNPTAQCFVSGVPGSFYGGLFPSKSLDFVYSSFSLQWLSQVPEGLESNRKNIHMAMASPPEVFEAYLRQYQRDFSIFLSSRGEEMAPGGRMVLTFVGRSVADPSSKDGAAHFTLLADTLLDMINEEGGTGVRLIRAYTEPILATHFGTSIMDDLYTRYAKKLAEYLSVEIPTYFIHVVSLSKK
ncbi:UNVERIFIED_CONTAM: Benzoate carboxyl methyltransferase, partial [Sesamum radiatum]